jgi:hypothetical protein
VPDPVAEPDPLQHLQRAPAGRSGRRPAQQQRQLDVLGRGEHRDQVEGLEDEAHRPGPVGGALGVGHGEQVLALDQDPAAVDVVQPGQAIQQGGLARPGWTHHRDQLPPVHGQVEPDQGLHLDLAGPVDLPHLLGHQQRLAALVKRDAAHRVSFLLLWAPVEHPAGH